MDHDLAYHKAEYEPQLMCYDCSWLLVCKLGEGQWRSIVETEHDHIDEIFLCLMSFPRRRVKKPACTRSTGLFSIDENRV